MEIELEVIRWIQSFANPFWDAFFTILTMLGEKMPLIAVFSIVYWTVDKEAGERLAWSMSFSLVLNGGIKGLVNAPRPIGEPGIRSLRVETATGSSFPSGHSQNAATFYPAFDRVMRPRGRVVRAVLWFLPLAVALSRLYLGVHYPRDTLVGLALGYASVFFTQALYRRVRRRVFLYVAAAVLSLPLLLTGNNHDLFSSVGCLIGFAAAAEFERRFVGFTTDIPAAQKVLRWISGAIPLGALTILMKQIFPPDDLFSLIRYAVLIFAGMGLYPWLFHYVERNKKA